MAISLSLAENAQYRGAPAYTFSALAHNNQACRKALYGWRRRGAKTLAQAATSAPRSPAAACGTARGRWAGATTGVAAARARRRLFAAVGAAMAAARGDLYDVALLVSKRVAAAKRFPRGRLLFPITVYALCPLLPTSSLLRFTHHH